VYITSIRDATERQDEDSLTALQTLRDELDELKGFMDRDVDIALDIEAADKDAQHEDAAAVDVENRSG
jgi:hypothetical protein